MADRIVPDTSIIIDGKITELVSKDEIKPSEIIIPTAVLDELQSQASKGKSHGFVGLDELKKLREVADSKKIKIRFTGERPSMDDIRLAHSGRIDAIIRDVAKNERGVLYTADYVQALVAEAEGVKVVYIRGEIKTTGLLFEKFFNEKTLSIHLKEGVVPMAKTGIPGDFELQKLREEPLTEEELESMVTEITEATRVSDDGSIEINRGGALVVQLGNYRIAVARQPFSDGLEVTIVRPIIKMGLEDYKLSDKLVQRISDGAEGIIIAGSPGSGKSTLAGSIAEFYMKKGKIVKTLESPKDLQVGPEITQYGPLEGDFEKTSDMLLLVRPDYTIYDEVRRTRDFQVFSDLRLAGIGMVGVVHSSKPIDAIQRFMSRLELGMIPHVIDTVIFVKGGRVEKVLELSLSVKVPSGMTEADLARPVVEVKDFETGDLEYEIYTFGEENIIVPVQRGGEEEIGVNKLAIERIMQDVRRFDPSAEVAIKSPHKAIIRVMNDVVPRIIGKEGSVIKSLEEKLGINIDIEPKTGSLGKEVLFGLSEKGNSIEVNFDKRHMGDTISMHIDNEFLFSATIGKKASIKIGKNSEIGKELLRAMTSKKKISALVQG